MTVNKNFSNVARVILRTLKTRNISSTEREHVVKDSSFVIVMWRSLRDTLTIVSEINPFALTAAYWYGKRNPL